ncbi:MAG: DUF1800 domain-containing protein [Planctomycetota bacterium]
MQSSSQDVHARLNLPPLRPRPSIPPPTRAPIERPSPLLAARLAYQRRFLATLGPGASAGGATPVAPPERVPHDPVLRLVQRITNGFHLGEYQRAKALGYEAYLEEQLNPETIDDSALEERLTRYTIVPMSPKEAFQAFEANPSPAYLQLKSAVLTRAVNSKRQLKERMCEFWRDHLNIDHNKELEWALLPETERTVTQAHALGTFPALLSASAFSAGMLYYLDNWLNVRGAPQENYGRELMELHTLSVLGGYYESDVKEVSKCFTGWTLNGNPASADWLRAKYDPRLHTPGRKFLLGHVVPTGHPHASEEILPGQREAQDVLDILVAHPSTAKFLATKLIRWFLNPNPPAEFVDRVAQTYLDTGGDIRAMLRVILARENLAFSSPLYAPKFRRPYHLVTSLFRTFDGVVNNGNETMSYLTGMGLVPLDCAPPTGYPDSVDSWGPLLLPRWSFAAVLLKPFFGNYRGVSFMDINGLEQRIGAQIPIVNRRGLALRINENLLGGTLTPREEDLLQQFIAGYPGTLDYTGVFDCLCLAASMPGFQWY